MSALLVVVDGIFLLAAFGGGLVVVFTEDFTVVMTLLAAAADDDDDVVVVISGLEFVFTAVADVDGGDMVIDLVALDDVEPMTFDFGDVIITLGFFVSILVCRSELDARLR